jgi:hypothetical protein
MLHPSFYRMTSTLRFRGRPEPQDPGNSQRKLLAICSQRVDVLAHKHDVLAAFEDFG